jgi:UDPglucose 6-dehydrogenase
LVTGACFAGIGHRVVCTDNDLSKIAMLEAGHLPIFEPHLDTLVERTRRSGHLRFTGDVDESIRAGEAIFICVGTPPLETGEADLSAIDGVARTIATVAQSSKLVVEKSTVPVQTGQQLARQLAVYGRNSRATFRVASNPEFLREGTAVGDFLHPDRIVVGVEDPAAEQQLREIYSPLLEGGFDCPVHPTKCPPAPPAKFLVTTINSAELIKHASNSFLALKISYANLIADLCDRMGANVDEVTRAMGLDPRIGPHFLRPGIGFGGFCLPKDIQAFIHLGEKAGVDFGLLKEAERINRRRVDAFIDKLRRALWVLKEKQVGVLGLAFKPDTDDVRFAPAIELIRRLLAEGVRVRAYDPQAVEKTRPIFPEISYAKDPYEVAEKADALLIATEWKEFRELDWARIHNSMARPLLFDGRNLLDPAQMRHLKFEYHSVGRPD